jgi:acyl-CoA synthetase (AMP-forming)/AMP-acid ligase II
MRIDTFLDGQKSISDGWRSVAEQAPHKEAVVHYVTAEEPYRWSWGEMLRVSSLYAKALKDKGVRKGDICAIIIRHHKDFYPIYMGISILGALPAVLAYPNTRLHPDKFRQGLEGMVRRSGLDYILTEKDLGPVVNPMVSGTGSTIRAVLYPFEWSLEGEAAESLPSITGSGEDAPCLLQHSSGTTGLQKAVVLTHRAVLEHVRHYGRAIDIRQDDKVVSWLPLYHDMGLIAAFYLPLTLGIPLVQLDPFEWVSAPVILLEAISREKGTLVWLPNFAYNLMADRIREDDLDGIRLESLRMLINCAEPVRAESHEKFLRRYAPYGLRKESLAACYAMAETTFAATQTTPGQDAKQIIVAREALSAGIARLVSPGEIGRTCVSSGAPISGCELQVLDDDGNALPENGVGEIAIRSVSLFDGYHNNPEKTEEVLKDGWYFSGDYGFLHAGEYYIIGRKKDIIILAGNNIYPEDIEDVVGQVEGVLPGRVVAFGVEDDSAGTEQICVVAETQVHDKEDRKKLRMEIVQAGMGIDVTISKVYLSPPRWLIKSSSGKPARKVNMERAIAELEAH